jgi:hypothetical protein
LLSQGDELKSADEKTTKPAASKEYRKKLRDPNSPSRAPALFIGLAIIGIEFLLLRLVAILSVQLQPTQFCVCRSNLQWMKN